MTKRNDTASMWRQAADVLTAFARRGRLGSPSTATLGRYTGARV